MDANASMEDITAFGLSLDYNAFEKGFTIVDVDVDRSFSSGERMTRQVED